MEFTAINKRISLPIPEGEYPYTGYIDSEKLKTIFRFEYPEVEKVIRTIVGEHLLNADPRLLFRSQVASCFLSNSMDLLQCHWQFTESVVPYVQKMYVPTEPDIVKLAMRDYDSHNGKALVGGLFKHKDLKRNSGFWSVYNAVKQDLFNKNERMVKKAIDAHKDKLGSCLCERVMETTKAMLFLIANSHDHHSGVGATGEEGQSRSD